MDQVMEDLLQAADELQQLLRDELASKLPSLPLQNAATHSSQLVSKFALARQIDALHAAVHLTRIDLGHLGLPLVRPACEERIWLQYLFTLNDRDRNELTTLMARSESADAVIAQHEYVGGDQMERLGFPTAFISAAEVMSTEARQGLSTLRGELGWPKAKFPSTWWVAAQVGFEDLYRFLYSASSKGVHLSPGEALRSGWTSGSGGETEILADPYRRYRAHFAVYWQCHLLVTMALVVAEGEEGVGGLEWSPESGERMLAVAARVGGKVPIVLPEEFNLRA